LQKEAVKPGAHAKFVVADSNKFMKIVELFLRIMDIWYAFAQEAINDLLFNAV
jgi:hypothetical protein